MKITNGAGLTPAELRAVTNLQLIRKEMRAAEAARHEKPTFSTTELLKPPYQTELCRRYDDSIEVEAEGLIWSLWGSAVHEVIRGGAGALDQAIDDSERLQFPSTSDLAALERKAALSEVSFAWEGPHGILTGRPDCLEPREDGAYWLMDYKTAKCWAVVIREQGDKDSDQLTEWKRQVRLYRFLCGRNGLEIYRATVEPRWKDWSESKINSDANYPHKDWSRIDVTPLPDAAIIKWINNRMQTLLAARKVPVENLNPCSPRERWERGECFAVQKSDPEGRPTGKAKKLFRAANAENIKAAGYESVEAAAQAYISEMAPGYDIHHRLPDRTRCRKYCVARRVCPSYQKFLVELEKRDAEA